MVLITGRDARGGFADRACGSNRDTGTKERWYRSNAYLALDRIAADTGCKPEFTLETGVADYVALVQADNSL